MGTTYYLYKRTFKRIPGKKYLQPVDTYIGIITPEGIVESKKKRLATTSVEVKEYSFSKAVLDSCPNDWKKVIGDDWKEKLSCMILKWSPESYLSKEYKVKTEEELGYPFDRLDKETKKMHGNPMRYSNDTEDLRENLK